MCMCFFYAIFEGSRMFLETMLKELKHDISFLFLSSFDV